MKIENKKNKNILKLVLVFLISTTLVSQSSLAGIRSFKSACDELLRVAKLEGTEPISPRYFDDPFQYEANPIDAVRNEFSEFIYSLKGIMFGLKKGLLKYGQTALIIGYNEGYNDGKDDRVRIRPGVYAQRKDSWYELPTDVMADQSYYEIRPIGKPRKDGTIKSLHILSFHLPHNALKYSVILDDYNEREQIGKPKIIVRGMNQTAQKSQMECVSASKGQLALRVFARNYAGDFIVGTSIKKESPRVLRDSVLENKAHSAVYNN